MKISDELDYGKNADTQLVNVEQHGRTDHGNLEEGKHMPIILGLIALITPRAVIFLLWLFSGWFNGLFPTVLVPVLGFIFLPTSLLWYTAVLHWWHGQWTLIPVVGIVIALMTDLFGGTHRRWRRSTD
jgi:hypothetical protein